MELLIPRVPAWGRQFKNCEPVMAKKSSRDAILDAAERTVFRLGFASATVEAVAAEAGVSKGGIFYHFPSKNAIFLELIDRHVARHETMRLQLLADLPESPSKKVKAALVALIRMPALEENSGANLMALLEVPELRDKVFGLKRKLYEEIIGSSPHPEKAALAVLASEGLWVANLLGQGLFTKQLRDKVVEELQRYIDSFDT